MAEAPMAGVIDVVSRNLDSILERLRSRRSDMDRYRYLMGRIGQTDVRADADFQRTFNGLYMVRRGASWRKAFYDLFESEKTNRARSFQDILATLHKATGRIEASFASKLLATVDPTMPVYDSWVRINLSLKTRTGPPALRMPALCADYAHIFSAYAWMVERPEWRRMRTSFDDALPDLSDLGDVKKIDLLLWQARSP